VRVLAQSMKTDAAGTFDGESRMKLVGFEMTRAAAVQAYELAGIGPEDVDVVELHDCFSTNEIIS
jgi:acetyl-CoA acetyltransferase